MIVILDTNALHGDVYAQGQGLSTLFEACDQGLLPDTTVWTPQGVVEELIRQYRERAERMRKVIGAVDHDLSSFRISRPPLPSTDAEGTDTYRQKLTERLTGPGRKVAPHPRDSARIVDWAAQRRAPIVVHEPPSPPKGEPDLRVFAKPKTKPVYGVVDAAIWLTVIEGLRSHHNVALITKNTADFADPADLTRPAPQLAADIEEAGCDAQRVTIYPRVLDFTSDHVEPIRSAVQQAELFLADEGKREALKAEISDTAEWFQPVRYSDWSPVEIDHITLASFDPSGVDLRRADPAPHGIFITAWVDGDARLDLGIHKGDAIHIPDGSPIMVYDWDFNESMVAAEAEVPARLLVEAILYDSGELSVSIEDVELES